MASEIRVNQIQSRTGVSTVSFTDSGPILAGVSTVQGSLTVDGGVTGNVTGNLTGNVTGDITSSGTSTFDVISGVSTIGVTTVHLTGINDLSYPTADGTDGQVLKTNGSGALSFASVPLLAITEVDQWRLQSDATSNGVITDLVRNPEPSATYIGTGMSASSGVFTFPSTGKWLVLVNACFVVNNSDSVILYLEVTQDNNNWDVASIATDGSNGTGARNSSGTAFHFMDVTDTSQVKVRFNAGSLSTGSYVTGNNTFNETSMLFVRLGDT
jgi:hypothetical protein